MTKNNLIAGYIYNIRTLSVNIKSICTSFRNRQNSEPSASFSGLNGPNTMNVEKAAVMSSKIFDFYLSGPMRHKAKLSR
jgi:hypothetical protein